MTSRDALGKDSRYSRATAMIARVSSAAFSTSTSLPMSLSRPMVKASSGSHTRALPAIRRHRQADTAEWAQNAFMLKLAFCCWKALITEIDRAIERMVLKPRMRVAASRSRTGSFRP